MNVRRPARPHAGWTPPACLVLAVVCLLTLALLAACGDKPTSTPAAPAAAMAEPTLRPLPPPAPAVQAPPAVRRPAPRATRSRAPERRTAPPRADRSRSAWADVTRYCLRGTMANGRQVHQGAVASLSRAVPFGTRVRIAGRVYTVEDRVGHGTTWDVWTPSCADARAWGRQRLLVEVLP